MADKPINDLCQKARELMFDYADETLDERDSAWLEAHITSCPDCAEELAKCRETLKLIKVGRYDPPFSIADAVMNAIGKEEQKSPFASALIGSLKKHHFARYGTIVAALILISVVVLNQDILSKLTDKMTLSNTEYEDVALYDSAKKHTGNEETAYDAYSYTGEGVIDETVQHIETVSGMMMAAPSASGSGSVDEDSSSTDASAAQRAGDHALETSSETELPEKGEFADRDLNETVTNDFDLIETSENSDESDWIFYSIDSAESYGNVIAYLNVSDLNAAMSVLGLTEYATLENSDGKESILCEYTYENRADIIDYLRLININYAVHYSGNDISENEINLIVLSEIK